MSERIRPIVWWTAINVPLIVAGAALVTLGVRAEGTAHGAAMLGAGIVVLALIAAGGAIAAVLVTRRPAGGSNAPISHRLEDLLAQIHHNTMLSDNAKRVLFRERELELLRHAIEEDIARGDYSAGLILCDEMANVFGYRHEAETFRSRIMQARHDHYDEQVHAAVARLDELLARRDWAAAHQEAARIRRLFPDSHFVHDLDRRIHAARNAHKLHLEDRFREAAQREDVEEAMVLLRELDLYLTREEAAALTDVAQSVVTRHRENLSVQFKLAVNDHRWTEAVQIGEAIVTEFPNSKMADEVRSMEATLRARAGQSGMASGQPG